MKIGCCALVQQGNYYLGIQSQKRGIILPGGKWLPGETFKEAAERECLEETGTTVLAHELIFSGMPHGECFTYVFRCEAVGKLYPGYSTHEGVSGLFSREELLKSEYGAFYELMFDSIR